MPLALREYDAQTGQIGQTYAATLALPPDAGRDLLPGASAVVRISRPSQGDEGLTVPSQAVVAQPDRSTVVYVFTDDGADGADGAGTVTPAEVVVMSPDGTKLQVQGLEPGQEIVAAGAHLLEPGQNVRRFTGFSKDN